jgi:hypothetical protein
MPKYCDKITFSFARQRLGIHVSAKTDTQATIKDIVVLHKHRAETIQREPSSLQPFQ